MSVWTDGTLRGTCPPPRRIPYTFPVLAVDSIGAHSDPLTNVGLTVNQEQCTYVYSDWSACQPDNTQTRTVISSSPEGCVGTPILTQSCTYVPPVCTFSISPAIASFGWSGGNGSVTVTASDSSCAWTITNSLSWVTITSVSGTGNVTVSYSVPANTSTSSRTGTITIAGQTFTITQAAQQSCTYTISPTSQTFASSGGTGNVTVTASDNSCAWTDSENLDWVSITSGSSGTGSGTVSYSVSANTSTSSRTGTITIAGQTFTIEQTGSTPTPPCTYYIIPTSQTIGADGGYGSVSVKQNEISCVVQTWTAVSNTAWISRVWIGSLSNGQGPAHYYVEPNSSSSQRTGTITIAENTFTVLQDGASTSSPFKGSMTGTWQGCGAGGGFSLTIDANGAVTGSYSVSGSTVESISGTVNTSGNFSGQGSAGAAVWNGQFSVSGTTLSGSGTWSMAGYCGGNWSGTGPASH